MRCSYGEKKTLKIGKSTYVHTRTHAHTHIQRHTHTHTHTNTQNSYTGDRMGQWLKNVSRKTTRTEKNGTIRDIQIELLTLL